MIKNVLSDIGGVGLYGVISISLFFAVFIGMLIWALRMKKSFAQSMSALPLNDGEKKKKSHPQGPSHE
jgi:cbb3-type cytochrome oxidase subunit 3